MNKKTKRKESLVVWERRRKKSLPWHVPCPEEKDKEHQGCCGCYQKSKDRDGRYEAGSRWRKHQAKWSGSSLVLVVDDGKVVEMCVPRETNLLFKVSPSYEELLPLDTSLDSLPTSLHHRPYSIALKSLLDLTSTRSHMALVAQPSHTELRPLW